MKWINKWKDGIRCRKGGVEKVLWLLNTTDKWVKIRDMSLKRKYLAYRRWRYKEKSFHFLKEYPTIHFLQKPKNNYFFFKFIHFESDRKSEWERGRGRRRERIPSRLCTALSAWSPMWGSKSRNMRPWTEPKLDT